MRDVKAWKGAIVALALASSLSSVRNGFVFDDVPLIVENDRVHALHNLLRVFVQTYWPPTWGGTLYRPLTVALFTIEWVVGHGSPVLFHLVNVALYAAVCLAVYALARRLLDPAAAWFAAALFAVHPVHVEAVANVVGQSELLVALAVTSAVAWYVAQRRNGGVPDGKGVALLASLYAAGLLSKEHAIVLPGLLLLAECTVVQDDRPWMARLRSLRLLGLAFTLVAVAYLSARVVVIGGVVGEVPSIGFIDASLSTRWWTMLGVVAEWVRLLVFPAHLAADYSPPATALRSGPDAVALAGLGVLVAALALAIAARRRQPVVSFGIGWIGIVLLPTSNVIVRSGVLLAERTLFLPSVGAVIAIAAALRIIADARVETRMARAAVALVLAAGIWRSATRALVWHDNDTLFESAVRDEPRSYDAHVTLAGLLFNSGRIAAGEHEMITALHLYGDDPRPYIYLALADARVGHCEPVHALTHRALELWPTAYKPRLALGMCLVKDRQYDALHHLALTGMGTGAQPKLFRDMLATADSGVRADSLARHP